MKMEINEIISRYTGKVRNAKNFRELADYSSKVTDELDALFALREVSGSIVKNKKPRLMAATPKQIKEDSNLCRLCKYDNKLSSSKECCKCDKENNGTQYYL